MALRGQPKIFLIFSLQYSKKHFEPISCPRQKKILSLLFPKSQANRSVLCRSEERVSGGAVLERGGLRTLEAAQGWGHRLRGHLARGEISQTHTIFHYRNGLTYTCQTKFSTIFLHLHPVLKLAGFMFRPGKGVSTSTFVYVLQGNYCYNRRFACLFYISCLNEQDAFWIL